jgi:formylglycine-generating enzyme
MSSDANIAGIARNSPTCSPNCTYSVQGSPNHPVTYVSWGDAARFANWLNNGQPTGAEGPGTTEAGAYTLNGATDSGPLMAVARNANGRWFIPSESEWYKAAYYQPAAVGGDSDGYWAYPTKSNTAPNSVPPPGSAAPDPKRAGNFYFDDFVANGHDDGYAVTDSTSYSSTQNYLTDVGSYTSAPSYYGTFDQGGNVFEWNEAHVTTFTRGIRGGSWADDSIRASFRGDSSTPLEYAVFGFRVVNAAIPEPSTAALVGLAAVALFNTRRRRDWFVLTGPAARDFRRAISNCQ